MNICYEAVIVIPYKLIWGLSCTSLYRLNFVSHVADNKPDTKVKIRNWVEDGVDSNYYYIKYSDLSKLSLEELTKLIYTMRKYKIDIYDKYLDNALGVIWKLVYDKLNLIKQPKAYSGSSDYRITKVFREAHYKYALLVKETMRYMYFIQKNDVSKRHIVGDFSHKLLNDYYLKAKCKYPEDRHEFGLMNEFLNLFPEASLDYSDEIATLALIKHIEKIPFVISDVGLFQGCVHKKIAYEGVKTLLKLNKVSGYSFYLNCILAGTCDVFTFLAFADDKLLDDTPDSFIQSLIEFNYGGGVVDSEKGLIFSREYFKTKKSLRFLNLFNASQRDILINNVLSNM